MPRISVITPIYNGERFINLAKDSLLKQSYTDWEWVVVDDGSSDATPTILSTYEDPRFKIVHQKNAGEAAARNHGLTSAHGEYVAFLDADDEYLPNALDDLITFLDNHPEYDVVYSDGYLCDENGEKLSSLSNFRTQVSVGDILEPLILSVGAGPIAVNCTLTRRNAIEQNDVRFDPNLMIGPDWDFWIQMARFAKFGFLDQATCLYRIHTTNVTRTSGKQKRHQDLIKGRMKILNSSWFNDLSVNTRQNFFYYFLIALLSGRPQDQQTILEHASFCNLPPGIQGSLYRYVGIDTLLTQVDNKRAKLYFDMSLKLNPYDKKTSAILTFLKINRRLAVFIIQLWQKAIRIKNQIKSSYQKRTKAVPPQLQPVGE
jgi:glycosyltransferase involved in cell wall biosynthesis